MVASMFFASIFIILYVYMVYPLVIFFLSKIAKKNNYKLIKKEFLPDITIVIPLFNESSLILKKYNDFCSINYPHDKISYIFVSDGATDDSNNILSVLEAEHDNVSAVFISERMGKPNALNLAMEKVDTDIVFFSDIRQTVSEDALINMVSELESSRDIGLVCGELVHVGSDGSTSKNVGVYWKYEKWIRHSESDLYSTVGTTGALYVFYKKDYTFIDVDTILDDFEIPMNILRKGKKLKISSNAFMYDYAHDDLQNEKHRKIRTLSGNYQSFFRMRWLFSPINNPVFFQFISHKVLRLLIPYMMLICFVSNALLLSNSPLYLLFFIAQVMYYILVFLAHRLEFFRNNKISNFCLVFFELNLAVVYSLYRYLTNQASVTWKKT